MVLLILQLFINYQLLILTILQISIDLESFCEYHSKLSFCEHNYL